MGEVLPRYENHIRIDPKVVDEGIPVLSIHAHYTDNEFNILGTLLRRSAKSATRPAEVLNKNARMFPPASVFISRDLPLWGTIRRQAFSTVGIRATILRTSSWSTAQFCHWRLAESNDDDSCAVNEGL
jgi:hypothetical protein